MNVDISGYREERAINKTLIKLCNNNKVLAEKICRNSSENEILGDVVFNDTITFHIKNVDIINKVEMFYGKKLIAMRMIPTIFADKGDIIDVDWTLTISGKHKRI